MQVRLTRSAFLEGSRQAAGTILSDYQGPLADWMEVVGTLRDEQPAASKRRKARAA